MGFILPKNPAPPPAPAPAPASEDPSVQNAAAAERARARAATAGAVGGTLLTGGLSDSGVQIGRKTLLGGGG